MDLFRELADQIERFGIDTFDYNQARANREKYIEVVERLTEKTNSCQSSLEEVKQVGIEIDQFYNSYSWTAQGEWVTRFSNKEQLWNVQQSALIKKMEETLEILKERKKQAEDIIRYWDDEVYGEEQRIRDRVRMMQEENNYE